MADLAPVRGGVSVEALLAAREATCRIEEVARETPLTLELYLKPRAPGADRVAVLAARDLG